MAQATTRSLNLHRLRSIIDALLENADPNLADADGNTALHLNEDPEIAIALIHISEVSNSRIRHPSDVLKVGQDVEVRVLDVDPAAQRISLSLKEDSPDAMDQAFRPKSQGKSLGTFGDLFANKLG